jgi:hypothetical protein
MAKTKEPERFVLVGVDNGRVIRADTDNAPSIFHTWEEAIEAAENAVLKRGYAVEVCSLKSYVSLYSVIRQVATAREGA